MVDDLVPEVLEVLHLLRELHLLAFWLPSMVWRRKKEEFYSLRRTIVERSIWHFVDLVDWTFISSSSLRVMNRRKSYSNTFIPLDRSTMIFRL